MLSCGLESVLGVTNFVGPAVSSLLRTKFEICFGGYSGTDWEVWHFNRHVWHMAYGVLELNIMVNELLPIVVLDFTTSVGYCDDV